MSDIKCASCDSVLARRELDEGWCGNCGKPIPMFIYHQNGLKGPRGKALPQASAATLPPAQSVMDPEEKLPAWQIGVIGVIVLALAAVIVGALI